VRGTEFDDRAFFQAIDRIRLLTILKQESGT
jgi:hypothetical protein